MQNISNIIKMLQNGEVGHQKYNIFLIYEPKCRLVMSLSVKDKIINHFITRYFLETNLSKYLDIRNCATRKNMGTDYAICLLKKYLEKMKTNEKIYCLKLDIKKYFYTIDHSILKALLKEKLDDFNYHILESIIDSTNKPYINEVISYYKNKANADIILYEKGKGLPIGNMTSQFLSIFYLYKIDHFIIHDLHLKNYIRYMDDMIILSNDKEKLLQAKIEITRKLLQEYKLKVHEKKTMIVDVEDGFSFLGYTFKIKNKKTIIKLKRSNCDKIKKRVKKVKKMLNNDLLSYNSTFGSIMTYQYGYKFCDNIRVKNIINRYFYNEK